MGYVIAAYGIVGVAIGGYALVLAWERRALLNTVRSAGK